jgi:hypothetical protein
MTLKPITCEIRRKHGLVIACAVWLALSARLESTAQPQLFVAEQSADLGLRPYNSVLDHVFMVENKGDADLILSVESTSCGCLSGLETSTIVSGGVGEVPLRYDPSRSGARLGYESFSVVMVTNDPRTPRITFEVFVQFGGDIRIVPPLLDFGTVESTDHPSRILKVLDERLRDEDWFEQLKFTTSSDLIQITPAGSEAEAKLVSVSILPQGLVTDFRETIIVRFQGDDTPHAEVPIRAAIAYPMSALPQAVLLGIMKPGDVKSGRLKLVARKTGGVGCALSIDTTDARLRGTIVREDDSGSVELETILALPRTAVAERFQAQLIVKCQNGDVVAIVPVKAIIRK